MLDPLSFPSTYTILFKKIFKSSYLHNLSPNKGKTPPVEAHIRQSPNEKLLRRSLAVP